MKKEQALKELGMDLFDRLEQGEVVTMSAEPSHYDERDPELVEMVYRRNGRNIEFSSPDEQGFFVLYEDVFEK